MKTVYARDRKEWRAWLENNHAKCREIWLVYYKKNSGKPRVSYDDAVEEAICFGWIDGMIRKIDEDRYVQRFTPRQPRSSWTRLNIGRAERLIAQGKMTPAGLEAFRSEKRREAPEHPTEIPQALQDLFRKEPAAWEHYQRCPPYYRRMTAGWIASAKKPETQLKRLRQLMDKSARGERLQFM